jgi:hypothetical protein
MKGIKFITLLLKMNFLALLLRFTEMINKSTQVSHRLKFVRVEGNGRY